MLDRMNLYRPVIYGLLVFSALITGFIAKENVEPYFFSSFSGFLIATVVFADPFFPRKRRVDAVISVPIVVGHDNAGIPRVFAGLRHFFSG